MGLNSFPKPPSNKNKEVPDKNTLRNSVLAGSALLGALGAAAIPENAAAQQLNTRGNEDAAASRTLDKSGLRIQRIDGSGSGVNRINLTPAEEAARDRAEARGDDSINSRSEEAEESPRIRPLNMNAEEWTQMKRAEDAAKRAGNANERPKFEYLEDQ